VSRQKIEQALREWREAERELAYADGNKPLVLATVDRARFEFQRISAEHMAQQIDLLRNAEERRAAETPSTPEYHRAAEDETRIARDLWHDSVMVDGETPRPRATGGQTSA
jgi:hypothetical protein